MLSTRDELRHLIDCLSDDECERALTLLAVFQAPHCPSCHEADIDCLVWQEDSETVACANCGFCWQPNRDLVPQR